MLFRAITPLFLPHPYPPVGTLSTSFMDRCKNNMCIIEGISRSGIGKISIFSIYKGGMRGAGTKGKARVCGLGFSTAELVQNRLSRVGRCRTC